MDATFSQTREGALLRDLVGAYEGLDEDVFTEKQDSLQSGFAYKESYDSL